MSRSRFHPSMQESRFHRVRTYVRTIPPAIAIKAINTESSGQISRQICIRTSLYNGQGVGRSISALSRFVTRVGGLFRQRRPYRESPSHDHQAQHGVDLIHLVHSLSFTGPSAADRTAAERMRRLKLRSAGGQLPCFLLARATLFSQQALTGGGIQWNSFQAGLQRIFDGTRCHGIAFACRGDERGAFQGTVCRFSR